MALSAFAFTYSKRARFFLFETGHSIISAMADTQKSPLFTIAEVEGEGPVRLYLIHGRRHDFRQWSGNEFGPLREQPVQRIYINIPAANPDFFNDGGLEYCSKFVDWLAKVDQELGPAETRVVAGISYGGLLALHAANHLEFLDSYIAFMPVTDVSRLDTFRFQENSRCSPLSEPPKQSGFITYSVDDTVVGADLLQQLSEMTNSTVLVTDGLGHTTSPEQSNAAVQFLRTKF
ncbi:hypothetical protein GRI42_13405 [Erythrobacter gaetbuli]|uniref:Alpha/beta hydrolase n=1 Tax=Qipengyuania gaetbuli TaxID=266952 RepID=A0A844Y260_9SPHN|nr:alpha/beta hydrolase [Qipengyuania gaetbuli]MXO52305.1 hypothetical protein [Qipengyuania gaetbuli]